MTIPSKQIAIVDVPEVKNFNGAFQYSYFEPSEKRSVAIRSPRGDAPRMVKLSWGPVSVGNRTNINRRIAVDSGVRVSRFLNRVVREDEFSAGVFTPISAFQGDDYQEIKTALGFNTKASENLAPSQSVRAINNNTENEVDPKTIVNAILKPESYGLIYGSGGVSRNARTYSQLNSKIIGDVVNSGLQRGSASSYVSEFFQMLGQANNIQREASERYSSTQLSLSEYQVTIPNSINTVHVDPATYDPYMETIGYIIEKKLIKNQNGAVVELNPILIDSPEIEKFEDLEVSYGERYIYSIRCVAYVELLSQDENQQYIVTGFLVSSKPTSLPPLECVENIPPPWPVDFRVLWDYDLKSVRLSWGFPVNPQRDIKGFQVFFRKTIKEPFQLLRYFSFDDSVVKSQLLEQYIAPELQTVSSGPVCNFVHRGIDSGIYAICSVDAHGLSSNYSMQLRGSFDKSANRIRTELVSIAGAPKAYPNFYLNSDAFVDLIKFEGYNTLDVYFNPEYLKVFDAKGEDVDLLAVASDSTNEAVQPHYELDLVNIDNQKSQTVKISLRNRSGDFYQNLSLDS